MNRYNIVIPLHRFENVPALRDMFTQPNFGHCHCTYLVAAEELGLFYRDVGTTTFWEDLWVCSNEGRGTCAPGNWRIKKWLERVALRSDSDRFICLLNDDDYYAPDFFDVIDRFGEVSTDVIMVSMKRGDQIPDNGNTPHPTSPLEADPKALCFGQFGLEQVLFKASALQAVGVNANDELEATLIDICNENPMTLIPNAYVWFNYLEKGRWNI